MGSAGPAETSGGPAEGRCPGAFFRGWSWQWATLAGRFRPGVSIVDVFVDGDRVAGRHLGEQRLAEAGARSGDAALCSFNGAAPGLHAASAIFVRSKARW